MCFHVHCISKWSTPWTMFPYVMGACKVRMCANLHALIYCALTSVCALPPCMSARTVCTYNSRYKAVPACFSERSSMWVQGKRASLCLHVHALAYVYLQHALLLKSLFTVSAKNRNMASFPTMLLCVCVWVYHMCTPHPPPPQKWANREHTAALECMEWVQPIPTEPALNPTRTGPNVGGGVVPHIFPPHHTPTAAIEAGEDVWVCF